MGAHVAQQTVAHLGELDGEARARVKALARRIAGERQQTDLFAPADPPPEPVRERLLPVGRKEVPWATVAAVLVLVRPCAPSRTGPDR